jgi:hypothetical protein
VGVGARHRAKSRVTRSCSLSSVCLTVPKTGGKEDVEALISVAGGFKEVADISHAVGLQTGLLPQFATHHFLRVGPGTCSQVPRGSSQ